MASEQVIPTLNRCGWQMATPSPLVGEWISSYDGKHPLLDVGCAFGINAFEALKRGIPTIALDMEERHLDYIREHLTPETVPRATCLFGSLPNNIQVPDNSISGILVTDVFHFLVGNDAEESLVILHRKLVDGGKLVLTALSDKLLPYVASEEIQSSFYQALDRGEKWPGIFGINEEFVANLSNFISDDMKNGLGKYLPDSMQIFSQNQMEDALKRNGFDIKMSTYGQHPGTPDPDGLRQLHGIDLQIVAEKRRGST